MKRIPCLPKFIPFGFLQTSESISSQILDLWKSCCTLPNASNVHLEKEIHTGITGISSFTQNKYHCNQHILVIDMGEF